MSVLVALDTSVTLLEYHTLRYDCMTHLPRSLDQMSSLNAFGTGDPRGYSERLIHSLSILTLYLYPLRDIPYH